MKSETRIIAVSQRVVEVSARGEVRDCLDQNWTVWLQLLGFTPVPVPNHLKSVNAFLENVRPMGIILSGGNNLTLPVYDGVEPGVPMSDAYNSRDHTEKGMVEFALRVGLPLLGCCHGMQFLQAYFGGRLSPLKDTPVSHVAHDHEVAITDERFQPLAGQATVRVNSFHNYGIARAALAQSLVPFALSSADATVEGFAHRDAPILGIMWHPERRNPAAAFDRELATRLFDLDYFSIA